MDSNTPHEQVDELDAQLEVDDDQERERREGGFGAKLLRVLMALAAGGLVVVAYIVLTKMHNAQLAATAANESLRGARTRAAAIETRANDATRDLAAASARADALQTQLTASEAHAHDLEEQIGHVQTEREQLGAQLTAATARAQDQEALAARFRDLMTRNGSGETHSEANGQISLQLVDRVLFASGEAVVTPQGGAVLDQVAEILRTVPDKQIWIEGHTDIASVPHPERFPSNWELSTARALAVVHYLQDHAHIDPRRLAVVGFGQYRPLVRRQNARNRRIEIVLLPASMQVGG